MTISSPGFCFAHRLAQFGENVCIQTDREILTYSDIAARVAQIEASLGTEKRLVLIEMSLTIGCIIAYLAALKSGHPVILANPDDGGACARMVETFDVDIVIGPDGAIRSEARRPRKHRLHPDLALLLSTSGSTGSAKLVRLSYENIQSNGESIVAYLGLTPADVGALTLPLHYSYGLSILNSHICIGGSLYLQNESITDSLFLDKIDLAACTNLSGVPYSYEIFERLGLRDRPLPHLRFMTAAGGRLPPQTVRAYADYLARTGGEFFVMYGQTEAAPRIAYLPPAAAKDNADCIGIAIPNGELFLEDDAGRRIKANFVSGELVYRGPNVMMGYGVAAADLAKGRELEELHTGDIAERNESGLFRIIGRVSRFSKLAGLRISHDEIETRLSLQGVESAVTGDDERLVVVAATALDEAEIVRRVMEITSLRARHIRPLRCNELPRLPNGKIDYRTIGDLAAADVEERPQSVQQAFARAFWPRQVNADDSFVSLSGDSLTFVSLSIDLESMLGGLPERWEETKIAHLEAMSRATRSRPPDGKVAHLTHFSGQPTNWSGLDPNIYIRAFAISIVILMHITSIGVKGGASILMIMVGYSIARFQYTALSMGNVASTFYSLSKNILLYYFFLLFWFIESNSFRLPEVLLLSNIIGDNNSPFLYNSYWFVESYAQIVTAVILLFSIYPIRKVITKYPYGFGIAGLLVSILALMADPLIWSMKWHACSQGSCNPVSQSAYFAATGWCLYFSKNILQKFIIILICTIAFVVKYNISNMESLFHVTIIIVTVFLLSWNIILKSYRPVCVLIAIFAKYSYIIYLSHMIVFYFTITYIESLFNESWIISLINSSIAVGSSLIAILIYRSVDSFLRRVLSVQRQPVSG